MDLNISEMYNAIVTEKSISSTKQRSQISRIPVDKSKLLLPLHKLGIVPSNRLDGGILKKE